MRMMLLATAAAILSPACADAASFRLTYTTTANTSAAAGAAVAFDALLTGEAIETAGAVTRYRLLTIDGTRGGAIVTNDPDAGAGSFFYPATGSGAFIDSTGFSFLAGGEYYRLERSPSGYRELGPVIRQIASAALTITPVLAGDVPEPATWATMLAGFGLIGVALRRRTVALA